jgi:hypothetical protein
VEGITPLRLGGPANARQPTRRSKSVRRSTRKHAHAYSTKLSPPLLLTTSKQAAITQVTIQAMEAVVIPMCQLWLVILILLTSSIISLQAQIIPTLLPTKINNSMDSTGAIPHRSARHQMRPLSSDVCSHRTAQRACASTQTLDFRI